MTHKEFTISSTWGGFVVYLFMSDMWFIAVAMLVAAIPTIFDLEEK